jgi:2Fe-2S ferredoxin
MPKVTFLPLDVTVEIDEGESILDAAIDNDILLEHACGGNCACTTCHVIIKQGEDDLSEMEEEEEDMLDEATDVTMHSRLACQAKVYDDVVAFIPAYSGNFYPSGVPLEH